MAILSIQSHVVYGYAGNTAAVFPTQRLRREVRAVNPVEFSNHTGYGDWRGKVLGGELAEELVSGLDDRGVLSRCEAVLSGYLGDAALVRAVTAAVGQVREAAPNALYCCDPVMGDAGRGFYVKPDIPGIFKNELVPLADIATPNQFELEALTGIDIKNIDNARRAIGMVHEMGPKVILLTSYKGYRHGDSLGGSDSSQIGMLASDKNGIYSISTPELPIGIGMAGSGDITTSVFLSRYLETRDLKKALELCTASIFGIIEASWQAHLDSGDESVLMELRIIQNQNEIETPSRFFEAHRI
jgi:pyridoxine kinase